MGQQDLLRRLDGANSDEIKYLQKLGVCVPLGEGRWGLLTYLTDDLERGRELLAERREAMRCAPLVPVDVTASPDRLETMKRIESIESKFETGEEELPSGMQVLVPLQGDYLKT